MQIRYFDARYAGSGHDSLIWNISQARTILKKRYDAGERRCWLLGDAGYPLEPYIMTPYRSAAKGSPEAIYNNKHAKARNIVERTIVVLKTDFPVCSVHVNFAIRHLKPRKSLIHRPFLTDHEDIDDKSLLKSAHKLTTSS
ncbi:protein ALP1-like [Rhagoletis pomonella]|uniref:protein ALP1-like n=1 Tax=Rhagoletis pomonella TaxID=28610 RepID=UPI00177EA298|nr:protein ALP1-like [Rhagoletis pomonella]